MSHSLGFWWRLHYVQYALKLRGSLLETSIPKVAQKLRKKKINKQTMGVKNRVYDISQLKGIVWSIQILFGRIVCPSKKNG